MVLLSAALDATPDATNGLAAKASPQVRRTRTRHIEEIAAEHRTRWKKPFDRGPCAAEIIRAEREAR
jgi:hypothetical protein